MITEDPITSTSCWLQEAETRRDWILSLARGDTVDSSLVIATSLFLAVPPLFVCFVCYSIIIWRLWLRSGGGLTDQRRKENLRAFSVIASVFTLFVCCWLPATITSCVDPLYVLSSPIKARVIYVHLAIVDAALNPVLYMASMKQFKPKWWIRRANISSVATACSVGPSKPTTLQLTSQQLFIRTQGTSRE